MAERATIQSRSSGTPSKPDTWLSGLELTVHPYSYFRYIKKCIHSDVKMNNVAFNCTELFNINIKTKGKQKEE